MPQIKYEKKKEKEASVEAPKDDRSKVVSAYSEEGISRNKKDALMDHRFKIIAIVVFIVFLVVSLLLFIFLGR
ncbi:MAG: hypothetical protein IJU64_05170 [Bacilli bacterium]|nr:hypothetical protein [Bacilli bacterium]